VSITVSSKVASFEQYWLAAKVPKRRGFTLGASRSPVNSRYLAPDDRKPRFVEQPPYPQYAVIEAAIQLNLITTEQALALVENGKTLNEWIMEQSVKIDEPAAGKQKKKLDWLWLVLLLLFNLVVWAGLGWIVLRVVRSLL
jgi:hypothetical protein